MNSLPVVQPEAVRLHLTNPYTPEALAKLDVLRGRESKSHFSDELARSLGYPRATLAGPVIRDPVLLAVAQAWGLPWLERGGFSMRFRQPLFDGDDVVVSFSPVSDEEGASRTDFQVVNASGVACVVGWAALPPIASSPPALAEFPPTPMPSRMLNVLDGEQLVGKRLASEEVRVPEGLAAAQLDLIHAGLRVSHSELQSAAVLAPWLINGGRGGLDFSAARFPSATEQREQFFHLASLEDPLTMHSRVSGAFERKGSQYIETEHLIVANGCTPIAWRKLTAVTYLARAQDREQAGR